VALKTCRILTAHAPLIKRNGVHRVSHTWEEAFAEVGAVCRRFCLRMGATRLWWWATVRSQDRLADLR
jgi:hypothetical protein